MFFTALLFSLIHCKVNFTDRGALLPFLFQWLFAFLSIVPEDLSQAERDELSNIRRRKKELLDDIEVRMI